MCIGHIRSCGYSNLPPVSTEITRCVLFLYFIRLAQPYRATIRSKEIYGGGNLYIVVQKLENIEDSRDSDPCLIYHRRPIRRNRKNILRRWVRLPTISARFRWYSNRKQYSIISRDKLSYLRAIRARSFEASDPSWRSRIYGPRVGCDAVPSREYR